MKIVMDRGYCDATLNFCSRCSAAFFRKPMGTDRPCIVDIVDDGNDDLLVSVGDGYLYGVKNAPLRGPGAVRDVAPDTAADQDIDEVDTYDTLAAAWDPVPGATGYEVAAVSDDGKAVSAWKNVGTATETTLTGLSLKIGSKYLFAVRALSAAGPSVDVTTNGVVVVPRLGDGGVGDGGLDGGTGDVGDPSGCGCTTAPAGPGAAAVAAGLLALAGMVARRRKRS